jgi:hypothetical protein
VRSRSLRPGGLRPALVLAVVAALLLSTVQFLLASRADAADPLISQGKPVTASSEGGTGYVAANAVDGNTATRWASVSHVDPQWIRVDLGATMNVSKVSLIWDVSCASAYKIQVSNDDATYTDVYSTTTGAGGTENLTVSGSGRYVRVFGTVRCRDAGYSLQEFQVYGAAPATDSLLSHGRPAKASSEGGTSYVAGNAFDGNTATRWASSPGVDPQWIRVDLGGTATVHKIQLVWDLSCATAYKIQISSDDSTYTDLSSTTTGAGGTENITVNGSGRYVRMFGTARCRTGSFGYSLQEFNVFGSGNLPSPSASPTPSPSPTSGSGDEWTEVQSILNGIQGKATAPIGNVVTPRYTAGMLLGNGDLGVVAGGDKTTNQRFYFGKGDFYGTAWNNGHATLVPAILSAGNLTLTAAESSPNPGPVYKMTQDILNAEVRSTVQLGGANVSMRSYTADSDNAFITELSSPAGSPSVTIKAALALPVPDTHTHYPTTVAASGGTLVATRHNNLTGSGDMQSEFGVAVRPVGLGFSSTSTSGSTATGSFTLKGGQTVELATVYRSDTRGGSGGPSASTLASQATSAVGALTNTSVAALLSNHRAFWKSFWLKSFVQLNDSTMNSYWYGALYAVGSSSRPGKVLSALNGQWVIDDFTSFPRYWYNYNVQAPFYGVASANHPDLLQPYNVQQHAEQQWQKNYTAAAGYKGEMWERSMAPFHQFLPTPPVTPVAGSKNNRWADQKSNGAFAVIPSLWYYEYTQDQNFLTSQLYPNMKAVDEFYRDYATVSGSRLVIAHSSAHEASDDLNPNLDIGFFRRVETWLIATSQKLGVDSSLVPVWQSTLSKLAKMPTGTVNGKTVYLMAEDLNGDTSTSVTFKPGDQPINLEGGVYPGENIYKGSDPTEVQIALNTLQEMNSWGVTTGQNKSNGFPKEFPIAARVGWPAADLVSKLDAAIKLQWRSSNLTVAQSGGGIETSGTVEAVDSMLMSSVSGTLRLFGDADWPTTKNASFTRLRAKGAFTVSAALSGGKVGPVKLTSDVGGTVKVMDPWKSGTISVDKLDASGNPAGSVSFTSSGGVISFATAAGTSYRVTSTTAGTAGAFAVPFHLPSGGDSGLLVFAFGLLSLGLYVLRGRRRHGLVTA